ncbi:MAG: FlgT C-terminal domain-containing protein, partial [Gemmatimonadales bacterium]
VKTGDTLWDLARLYFNDPFLWPQIYRLNTLVVEDPHWIYPGEVLRLTGAETAAAVPAEETPAPAEAAPAPEAAAPEAAPGESAAPAEAAAEPESVEAAEPAEAFEVMAETSEPGSESGDTSALFPRAESPGARQALKGYTAQPLRPLRRVEFFSSGFLSENQDLPFGLLAGQVTPSQIASASTRTTVPLFAKVAIAPPRGGKYQVGDTLLLVRVDREIEPYGKVIVPTGMVQVIDVSGAQNTGEVIHEFSLVRNGMLLLPAEQFVDAGAVKAVPISDGVQGAIIARRDRQDLTAPQDVVFIDKGRKDGVAPGDVFEVRRTAGVREDGGVTIPEQMATLQVVHVREHTATARVVSVTSPDIPSGTKVRLIAKLPS